MNRAAPADPITVLLVEDNAGDARLVRELLSETSGQRFTVDHVEQLSAALGKLKAEEPDVVLLDLSLPDSQGLQTLTQMQNAGPHLPIVVLTGHDDEELALNALQSGAQDYLVKGRGDGDLLARSIRYAVERKHFEERLSYMAQYDALTGLGNRNMLRERLAQALLRAGRDNGRVALIYADIDRFKAINDALGHEAGDQFLKAVANRLQRCVRGTDTIVRLGADEFAVIVEGIDAVEPVADIAKKIFTSMERPFSLGTGSFYATLNLGIAMSPDCGIDVASLTKAADAALTRAKEQDGTNNYQFYIPEMHARALRRLALQTDLRHALEREELVVHYQPLVDLKSGEVIGAEALVRWEHPQAGLISPTEFIPIAEETNMILPLGEWVLRTVCAQQAQWHAKGMAPLRLWVNLSARLFLSTNLAEIIEGILSRTGIAPGEIGLELTERLLIENTEISRRTLGQLKKLGVEIALDDFGTGYSALSYLTQYPIGCLKIDRSLVSGLGHDAGQAAIVQAIIELGHNLGMTVLAEGVENADQVKALRARGCDAAQGYYYSRPIPSWEFHSWLKRRSASPVERELDALSSRLAST